MFRADASYIAVDVQVLAKDRPVKDLRRQDFVIRDEGQPQPIAGFGSDEQELDIVLLVDTSGSTANIQTKLREVAAEAMRHLSFRDRVGIVIFADEPHLVTAPTWDWLAVDRALHGFRGGLGGTELNRTLALTADFLKMVARPAVRRAIVMLTDNRGFRAISDDAVRNVLWESDVVVNAILFDTAFHRTGNANIRKFVTATGGDILRARDKHLPLAEMFQRIRRRYLLLYRAPGGAPGSVRNLRVELTPEARAGLKDLTIRSRTGYLVGKPGTGGRTRLGSP